ncbi:MAG: hypothetical protein V1918_02855 [Planctomycetota bacterium]
MDRVSIKANLTNLVSDDPFQKERRQILFRRDGGRLDLLELRHARQYFDREGAVFFEDLYPLRSSIGTGEYLFLIDYGPRNAIRRVSIDKKSEYREDVENALEDPVESVGLGVLVGRVRYNGHKSVAELLQEAGSSLSMRSETLNGVFCHVLEARTPYGTVTAYVAPSRGYNAMKWRISKIQGNVMSLHGGQIKRLAGENMLQEFEALEFQEAPPYFLPKRSIFREVADLRDAYGEQKESKEEMKIAVGEIDLSPDFAAQKAFQVNLPEGTFIQEWKMRNNGMEMVLYEWRNGRLVESRQDSEAWNGQTAQLEDDLLQLNTTAELEEIQSTYIPIPDSEEDRPRRSRGLRAIYIGLALLGLVGLIQVLSQLRRRWSG